MKAEMLLLRIVQSPIRQHCVREVVREPNVSTLVHTLKVWTSVDKNRHGVSQKPNHQKPIPFVFYLHHDGCLTEF